MKKILNDEDISLALEGAVLIDNVPIFRGYVDDDDRREAEKMTLLYQPNLQSILTTENMPDIPVDPNNFSTKVIHELRRRDVVIADGLTNIMIEMCKIFNYTIASQNDSSYLKSLAYPAQTGIGKSTGLKCYVSMLKNESSLIVVATVDEAIKYCEEINNLSNDNHYARCYYSLYGKKDNAVRVENNILKECRCIVITHKMFQLVNQSVNIDFYRLYQEKQRDLVVIDEKLSFYEQYKVTYKQIDKLVVKIEHSIRFSEKIKSIPKHKKCLKFIKGLKLYFESQEKHIITDKYSINILNDNGYDIAELLAQTTLNSLSNISENETEATPSRNKQEAISEYFKSLGIELQLGIKPVTMISNISLKQYFDEKGFDIEEMLNLLKNILNTRIDELFEEIKQLGGIENSHYKQKIKQNALKPILDLEQIVKDAFLLYKSNHETCIFVVNNISHNLGHSVILDATANLNEFYTVANRAFGQIGLVPATQIRKYSNLNIHKASGFNQSRTVIYRDKSPVEMQSTARTYLSYAYNELADTDDKMLIISHKDFLNHLERECIDRRIVFTHWGNHVGKNDWSDCNKVMIVGWNYLNPLAHLSNIYNAGIEIDLVTYRLDEKTIKNFEITQLADDLVQGVMRSRARIIDTKDGDCKSTDIYLFSKEDDDAYRVIELFESQFPDANILEWIPTGNPLPKKKTKKEVNADRVIDFLMSKRTTDENYLSNDVSTELEINKTTFYNLLKLDYFQEQLEKNNFSLQKKDGKSFYFLLN